MGAPGAGNPVEPTYLAAVDVGSNSFHAVIARLVGGEPVVVDRLRDPVQLAFGLDDRGRLESTTARRALVALRRIGQRLRSLPPSQVRAVGTHTLRRAANARAFLRLADAALGHPIEVISGREEARLIYLGVAHSLPDDPEPRLVVDIGGGSTEVILGERFEPIEAHSLSMGCVGLTRRFFPGGTVRRRYMDEALLAARAEVEAIERRFRDHGWGRAVGASGTVRAVADVLHALGGARDAIPAAGLRRLVKAVAAARDVDHIDLPTLRPERARVFPGGVAILAAVFDGLGIERMEPASGALREGVMYDLLGRIRHEDVRERTIRVAQERWHADTAQAARVERLALDFLAQAAPGWGLDPAEASRVLAWAARLHEVGLAVSYGRYQHHGAYLIANSDLPGFSNDDQALLAAIVAGHRRRLLPETFAAVPRGHRDVAVRLTILLRLAVLAHRERGTRPAPPFRLRGLPDGLEVACPGPWLDRHPLTRRDLDAETEDLRRVGQRLRVVHRR